MLVSLNVRNLALIREAEVCFGDGLNILTGETGAGKSLVIGSVNIALGGKTAKDIVRNGETEASVELVFDISSSEQRELIGSMGIPVGDDRLLILNRRIKDGRSIARINGNAVTAAVLRDISEVLIDIHGQHEHQSLLYKKNHKTILDGFAGEKLSALLLRLADKYHEYRALEKERLEGTADEAERARQSDLLKFEINEIEAADLKPGEDEELQETYSRMKNSRKITDAMETVVKAAGYENDESAGNMVGRAVMALNEVRELDAPLQQLCGELGEIDSLMNDFSRAVNDYMKNMEFSEEEFISAEERLDLINHLKAKYGSTIEKIQSALEEKRAEYDRLSDYESYRAGLDERFEKAGKELDVLCGQASSIRKEAAQRLTDLMVKALQDLNFMDVRFETDVRELKGEYAADGYNEVEFMISMNPGERLRPLSEVASGGELSRIMLALKTVLADEDMIDTLIFDEIDAGISGRTAQKVAEKLNILARKHQVICITHLPQIAAMADHHFVIAKTTDGTSTQTTVRELRQEETVEELSRLLSGAEVTDTVRENAAEMKQLANSLKTR